MFYLVMSDELGEGEGRREKERGGSGIRGNSSIVAVKGKRTPRL